MTRTGPSAGVVGSTDPVMGKWHSDGVAMLPAEPVFCCWVPKEGNMEGTMADGSYIARAAIDSAL